MLIQLRLPTQSCQQGGDTTQVLALPRDDLRPGLFTITVTSQDGALATLGGRPRLDDDYAPIGALPSSRTGMDVMPDDAGPAPSADLDLTPTCAEISAFLRTPLAYLPNPPAGLGPPECALESIDLGAPTPQPGNVSWFAHVLHLPLDSDVTRDSLEEVLAAGGIWYTVVFRTAATGGWPATNLRELAGGIQAVEVDGGQGAVQRVADDRIRMTWRPSQLAGSAQYVILGAAIYDADTILSHAQDTTLAEPPIEQSTN